MIKGIIWDFDGTLFDTYGPIRGVVKETFSLHEISFEDAALDSALDISVRDTILSYAHEAKASPKALEKTYLDLLSRVPPESYLPYKGILEGLIQCKKSIPYQFIITHRDHTCYDILAAHQMTHLFEEVITSESGYKRKPSPMAYQDLLSRYDLKENEVLCVGDRSLDAQAAQNAGIPFIYLHPRDHKDGDHFVFHKAEDLFNHVTSREVLERDKDFCQAVQEGRAAAWARFFHEEGIMVTGGHEPNIKGREAIRAYMTPFFDKAKNQLVWSPTKAEASIDGSLAYSYGLYTRTTDQENGELMVNKGKYTNVWKRGEDGKWYVLLDTGN